MAPEGGQNVPPTKAARFHVDQEMAQALSLAYEFRHPSKKHPLVACKAMRTAYAAHFRALMEFFHAAVTPT